MKCLKQLVLVLVIGVLCLSGTLDGQAASKEEQRVLKEYRSFKFGLTADANRQNHVRSIIQTTFETDRMARRSLRKKPIGLRMKQGYRSRDYSFYDQSKTLPRLMTLEFHTKKNQNDIFPGPKNITVCSGYEQRITGKYSDAQTCDLYSGR